MVEAPTSRALVLTEERVVPATLTAREREVLRWLAAGKSASEIARELWVTPATVSKHLHHIYRKLGVTSRTAALATTSRNGSRGSTAKV
jgi:DNA-binding CsgD family transcriptional regulator